MNTTKSSHLDWKTVYDQVCDAHNGIADFRAKLLALLPIASGAGIFLLLSKDLDARIMPHLVAIGIFGATVTLGLFVYELVGIHRCLTLRKCGHAIEARVLPGLGRFTPYPEENYLFVNIPVASLIVYPAVIGAWTYVAFIGLGSQPLDPTALRTSGLVAGLVTLSFIGIATLIRRGQDGLLKTYYAEQYNDCTVLRNLNQDTFDAEAKKKVGDDDWDKFLGKVLADEFIIRRSDPAIPNQTREEMIDWIEKRPVAERNLLKDEVVAWCNETLGVVTCPVTMNDSEGKLGRYQNIKVFKKQLQGNWQCLYWQVTKAPANSEVGANQG